MSNVSATTDEFNCANCGKAFTRRYGRVLCAECRARKTGMTWRRVPCRFCGKDVAVSPRDRTMTHISGKPTAFDRCGNPVGPICQSYEVRADDPNYDKSRASVDRVAVVKENRDKYAAEVMEHIYGS